MSKDSFDRDCALDVLREMTKLAIAPGQTANRTGEQMPTHQLGVPRQWVHFHAGANHEQAQQRTAQDPFMAGGMRSAVSGMGPRGMSARPPLNRNVATAPQGARAIHQPGMMRHASVNKEALKRLLSDRLMEKTAFWQGARAAASGLGRAFRSGKTFAQKGTRLPSPADAARTPIDEFLGAAGGGAQPTKQVFPLFGGNQAYSGPLGARAWGGTVADPIKRTAGQQGAFSLGARIGSMTSGFRKGSYTPGQRWAANRLFSRSKLPSHLGLVDDAGKLTPKLEPLARLGVNQGKAPGFFSRLDRNKYIGPEWGLDRAGRAAGWVPSLGQRSIRSGARGAGIGALSSFAMPGSESHDVLDADRGYLALAGGAAGLAGGALGLPGMVAGGAAGLAGVPKKYTGLPGEYFTNEGERLYRAPKWDKSLKKGTGGFALPGLMHKAYAEEDLKAMEQSKRSREYLKRQNKEKRDEEFEKRVAPLRPPDSTSVDPNIRLQGLQRARHGQGRLQRALGRDPRIAS